jgi:hypothetical protein
MILTGVTPEDLEKSLSQRHFAHHKSLGANPGLRGEKTATNRLSYGTAPTKYHNMTRLCSILAHI